MLKLDENKMPHLIVKSCQVGLYYLDVLVETRYFSKFLNNKRPFSTVLFSKFSGDQGLQLY